MNIEYIGRHNEFYNNKQPFAYINYDEKKEEAKADKVFEILKARGWTLFVEYGSACIWLIDKDEYSFLVEDYKQAKKKVGVR